jgi:TfoX/Sxy family transcriptional regulator of competence genes
MASKQSTVDFIIDQLASAGMVSAKKMFGEYGIYCGEKMVALVCDDQLFVKPTPKGMAFLGEYVEEAPYPGAKPCFLIPGERWDDRDWLSQLITITAAQLPAPKKKAAKKAR